MLSVLQSVLLITHLQRITPTLLHILVLKPPPGSLMQLSNYNFKLCCDNEIIYLSHIIYFNF